MKKKIIKKIQIGIIGAEKKNLPIDRQKKKKILQTAEIVGDLVAKNKAILITGGCNGVAEAAAKAAYKQGGIVAGTPGRKRMTANPWVTVEICTPIEVGDFIFAGILSCDVIIVLPGGVGTLAELAIAYRYRKPLIFIRGFNEDILSELKLKKEKDYPGYITNSAQEAVALALKKEVKNGDKGIVSGSIGNSIN